MRTRLEILHNRHGAIICVFILSFQFRSGYIKKCLEVERLQLMMSLKDKRIKELEAHIEVLSRYKGQ